MYIATIIIVTLLALLLIVLGSYNEADNCFWSTFLISVGCSLLASEVIAHSLDICAMGLKSFRDSETELIKKRILNGMSLRILTMDPMCEYVYQVDTTEGITTASTKQTIEDLIKWFEELKTLQKFDGQVELRVYDHYPYEFYFCIDDNMYIGPYQERSSQQTITYRYKQKSKGFDYYKTNFENLWSQYEVKPGD